MSAKIPVNAKVTAAGVIALLNENPGIGYSGEEIAANFDASPNAGWNMARRLTDSGDILCSSGVGGKKIYHVGPLRTLHVKQASKPAGEIVPPFRTTCWTPPLRGDDARMAAATSLAMTTRRA